MPSLDQSLLSEFQRAGGTWTACLLHALAREEARGRRTQRLTEPKLDTWSRFRGRLVSPDLVALLFEDAAVIHKVPFSSAAVGADFKVENLPEPIVDGWLSGLGSMSLTEPSGDYVAEQARSLGVPARFARSDLHVLKPHQKVLELPGTGGQIAHYLTSTQQGLSLQDNFTVACGSWQELTLAGIVALELGAPHSDFVTRADAADLKNTDHPLRQRSFDFVVGLHPDKGGLFRAEDQLAIWFPTAKVLLV